MYASYTVTILRWLCLACVQIIISTTNKGRIRDTHRVRPGKGFAQRGINTRREGWPIATQTINYNASLEDNDHITRIASTAKGWAGQSRSPHPQRPRVKLRPDQT